MQTMGLLIRFAVEGEFTITREALRVIVQRGPGLFLPTVLIVERELTGGLQCCSCTPG